jgi:hypothetical protein
MARNQLPPCRPETAGISNLTSRVREILPVNQAGWGLDALGIVQFIAGGEKIVLGPRAKGNRAAAIIRAE